MTADLLRRAATKIRDTAQAANTIDARTPYGDRIFAPVAPERWGDMVDGYLGGPVGAHAALWSPDVAELVANVLVSAAEMLERAGHPLFPARLKDDAPEAVLARRILGEDA